MLRPNESLIIKAIRRFEPIAGRRGLSRVEGARDLATAVTRPRPVTTERRSG